MLVWLNDDAWGVVVGSKGDVLEIELPDHEVHEFVHKNCLVNHGDDYRLLIEDDYLHQRVILTNEAGANLGTGTIDAMEGWNLIINVPGEDVIAIDVRSVFRSAGVFQTIRDWMDFDPSSED